MMAVPTYDVVVRDVKVADRFEKSFLNYQDIHVKVDEKLGQFV